LITSRLVLPIMRNASDKGCREYQNTHLLFNSSLRKSYHLWDKLEKYCRAGRKQTTIWSMRISCCIPKATKCTLRLRNTNRFSTVTMVTRTRLNVKLYVHCLPCFVGVFFFLETPQSLLLATGWTVRGSNPGGREIFRTRLDRPWVPPSLLYNRYRVFPGGKAAGAWCWPPTTF
jgi:hypothetical protein